MAKRIDAEQMEDLRRANRSIRNTFKRSEKKEKKLAYKCQDGAFRAFTPYHKMPFEEGEIVSSAVHADPAFTSLNCIAGIVKRGDRTLVGYVRDNMFYQLGTEKPPTAFAIAADPVDRPTLDELVDAEIALDNDRDAARRASEAA